MSLDKEEILTWSEMTFSEKVRYMFKNITVEPILFLHVLPSVFSKLATQNLNLEKACRVNLKYSDQVCSNLRARRTKNLTFEEGQVQKLVANMTIWQTVVRSSLPACLILFLGSWSDRKKRRKPFMLIPVAGEFIMSLGLILCVYFFYQLPMEVAGFVEAFIPAITGDWFTLLMATFSYLGDITTVEMRTVRIGILNMCSSIGIPLGTALSGIMLKMFGFYGVFSISSVMYASSFIYGAVRIKEAGITNHSSKQNISEEDKMFEVYGRCKRERWKVACFLCDLFDFQHVKQTLSVTFKEGPNQRRKKVVMLILAQVVMYGPYHAESTFTYLFMRYRFNWDEVKFSMFATYNVVIHIIGNSVVVGVFIHYLKFDDASVGILACLSRISARFVYAFAETQRQVLLAPLVDVFSWTGSIAMRSIASKLVLPEELGQLFSVYGAFEALAPLVYGPMFACLYARTLHIFPGAFLLLCGFLYVPAVAIFWWLHKEHLADQTRATENPATSNKRRKN